MNYPGQGGCYLRGKHRGPAPLTVLFSGPFRTAAMLLRLVEQLDLTLQQLIIEVHSLQLEIYLLLQPGFTDTARVQATLHDYACRRRRRLAFVTELRLGTRGYDATRFVDQTLLHELFVYLSQSRIARRLGQRFLCTPSISIAVV